MEKLEYIWIDGTEHEAQLRSKTKIYEHKAPTNPPIWGFDGSSTNQASGDNSDCVLNPVRLYTDPFNDANSLVFCEVLNTDKSPHPSNTRHMLETSSEKYKDQEAWFGIEQEYTLFQDGLPLGWPVEGEPDPQGPYYCGVGSNKVFGRKVSEDHAYLCGLAGVAICGTNAEVMPGQWEYQIGPKDPMRVADDLWVSRWLLHRLTEEYDVIATLHPKPMAGDWNGAGAHTNFSTKVMREEGGDVQIHAAIKKLGLNHDDHIKIYGSDNEMRLTGKHETCDISTFKWGVSDRGASIRVPWQVSVDGKGYLEDRRPSSNCDPYLVFNAILNTVCEV